ncbi:PREDICTED: uncharacterized protein LOC109163415 [Ipomoea nil]|uniref:uncharacterized protein LOC109163415 n=1 Tax=Ipomoea nil TaxID=35883 RepID=UPI000900D0EC|nr:PREDICTED: uncharacterized protein LOC109163415 [Ipomoea nil]
MVTDVLAQLSTTFKIRDLGRPRFFLGIEAVYDGDWVVLSQQRYMIELLRKAGMESCKPLATPMSLTTSSDTTAAVTLDDLTLFRQIIGSLMYFMITCPDLSFAVNNFCQFMHSPTQDHWAALKRVLRYVKGSPRLGMQFFSDPISYLGSPLSNELLLDLPQRPNTKYLLKLLLKSLGRSLFFENSDYTLQQSQFFGVTILEQPTCATIRPSMHEPSMLKWTTISCLKSYNDEITVSD